jgi:hypothetical protein
MNPDRKVDPAKITIINIKTLKGNIDAPTGADSSAIENYEFNFGLGTGFNMSQSLVGLTLTIEIDTFDKHGVPLNIRGAYTHEVQFKVEDLADFVDLNEEDSSAVMDNVLGGTLLAIVYSTVRGIIFSRTQGTSLNAVIMPVIDPMKMLETSEQVR